MSARHRRLKRDLARAQKALAEMEVDLVSYARVLDSMKRRKLAMPSGALGLIEVGRQATDEDCEDLRQTICDLKYALAEEIYYA